MAVDVDHSGHENTIIELRELLDPDTEYNDVGISSAFSSLKHSMNRADVDASTARAIALERKEMTRGMDLTEQRGVSQRSQHVESIPNHLRFLIYSTA